MTRLWIPKKPARTACIRTDMIRQVLPNPYFLQQADVGCRVFGTLVTSEDVGIKCQLVWDDAEVSPIFQMENRHQLLARQEEMDFDGK